MCCVYGFDERANQILNNIEQKINGKKLYLLCELKMQYYKTRDLNVVCKLINENSINDKYQLFIYKYLFKICCEIGDLNDVDNIHKNGKIVKNANTDKTI